MPTTRNHAAANGTDLPADQAGQPLDALLASYALGQLNPHLNALIASHLCLSPRSRHFVAGLESLHGEALEQAPVMAVPAKRDYRRDDRLAAIFASPQAVQIQVPRQHCSITGTQDRGFEGRRSLAAVDQAGPHHAVAYA